MEAAAAGLFPRERGHLWREELHELRTRIDSLRPEAHAAIQAVLSALLLEDGCHCDEAAELSAAIRALQPKPPQLAGGR
jgi:hypothetical protein